LSRPSKESIQVGACRRDVARLLVDHAIGDGLVCATVARAYDDVLTGVCVFAALLPIEPLEVGLFKLIKCPPHTCVRGGVGDHIGYARSGALRPATEGEPVTIKPRRSDKPVIWA
jgi:hypothetical protein